MKTTLLRRQRIAWLKRRARALVMPWVIRRDTYSCGLELLRHICPSQWCAYRRGCALGRLAMRMEKALLVALVLLTAACEPVPVPPKPEPPCWLTIEKESENDVPDSPEQVLIVIKTGNGKKWVATWEETK